jgi:uncharacterized protein (TIGR02145 family)
VGILFHLNAQAAPGQGQPFQQLQDQIDQVVQDQSAGDQGLQNQIDQEVIDRTNGDADLQSQIDDCQCSMAMTPQSFPPENPSLGDMYYNNTEAICVYMVTGWVKIGGDGVCDTVTSATGQVWMDRNLGASRVATSSMDSVAYGDLYQWGRGTDGHQIRTSPTTSTLSSSDNPGHGNFILALSSPYDWRSPQNNNLWQGVDGTNNPCPSGFRLPTETEWQTERASWSSDDSVGAFGSPLKLVLAGSRLRTSGALFQVGTSSYYWSSTVDGTNARALHFDSGHAAMVSDNRAYGDSVRCLQD